MQPDVTGPGNAKIAFMQFDGHGFPDNGAGKRAGADTEIL